MKISNEFIEDLHDRLDIEDVVSSYVSLRRTGKNLKGLCPFHSEKTPSFTVFPETKSFYCFGCGASGDVISFMMRIDNLDYVEAVKACAEKAGMSMPDESYDNSLSKLRVRLLSANREAARFYNRQLSAPENREALDYFLRRGLTPEIIAHFGLGYAPNDWRKLTDYLKGLGFTENELIQANLARRTDGKQNCYDNFRNRVMYPILDVRNNVIAFGGRVMDDSKPKYINTSDTPIYKKSNGVFALNFAKNTPDRKLILVEGYMDVIALHQAGITNAIACLGTAFTAEMANLLSRYADEILICYDNDEAGRKATKRALDILGHTKLKLKVIKMEGGKDADEIVRTYGKDRFLSLINKADNETEYKLNTERSKYDLTTDDGKLRYLTSAAVILAQCSPIECDIYTNRLSEEFNISAASITAQINTAGARLKRQKKDDKDKAERKIVFSQFEDKNNPERKSKLKAARAEETLIASLMRNPDFFEDVKAKIKPEEFVTDFNRRIAVRLYELLEGGYSTDLSMFAGDFSPTEMDSVSKTAMKADTLGNSKKECYDCIDILKKYSDESAEDVSVMSDEEYLSLFKNKKREENK